MIIQQHLQTFVVDLCIWSNGTVVSEAGLVSGYSRLVFVISGDFHTYLKFGVLAALT